MADSFGMDDQPASSPALSSSGKADFGKFDAPYTAPLPDDGGILGAIKRNVQGALDTVTGNDLPEVEMPTAAERAKSEFNYLATRATPAQLADGTFGSTLAAKAAADTGSTPLAAISSPDLPAYKESFPAAAAAAFMAGSLKPLVQTASVAPLALGGVASLPGVDPRIGDALFKTYDSLQNSANSADADIAKAPSIGGLGQLAGTLGTFALAPEAEAGDIASPFLSHLVSNVPRAIAVGGLPAGAADATKVVNDGGSIGQALGVGGVSTALGAGQFVAPASLGGNIAERALGGEAIQQAMSLGGAAAKSAIAPSSFAPAQAPDFSDPSTYLGAVLGALGPDINAPHGISKDFQKFMDDKAAADAQAASPIPEPAVAPLQINSPDVTAPAVPTTDLAPAPVATTAQVPPAVADASPLKFNEQAATAAFKANPIGALNTLDHPSLLQVAQDAGITATPDMPPSQIIARLVAHGDDYLHNDVLPEFISAARDTFSAPSAQPAPDAVPVQTPVPAGLGEAMNTPPAVQQSLTGPKALPAPTFPVDQSGNVQTTADQHAAITSPPVPSPQDLRAALGLTPDVLNAQKKDPRVPFVPMRDPRPSDDFIERAIQAMHGKTPEPQTEPEDEIATQSNDDSPPWWLAGQHAQQQDEIARAGQPAPKRTDLEPLRAEIGWDTRGGKLLRAPDEDGQGGHAPVIGRTPWVGKAGPDGESNFWRLRPDQGGKVTETQAHQTLTKYADGQPLTTREQRFIDYAKQVKAGHDAAYDADLKQHIADQNEMTTAQIVAARQELKEASVPPNDHREALSVSQLTDRAYDAGATTSQVLDTLDGATNVERARALWDLNRQLEEAHGSQPQSIRQRGETDNGSTDARSAADGASRVGQVSGTAGESAGQAEGNGTAVEQSGRSAAVRGDLFGSPTARDHVDAATRAKDAQRNGRVGGREDQGDGGLFDGKRPEQVAFSRRSSLPSQQEIVQELRSHPFTKGLVPKDADVSLVGSYAKGTETARSDIDVMVQVKGDAQALQNAYRKRAGDHFMKNNLQGVHDDQHPQWDGHRIDVYFTNDAAKDAQGPRAELKPRFSFAGESARTADLSARDRAQEMERQGRDSVPDRYGNTPGSPEEQHLATGWHRGVDGKMRFEIDDSEAAVHAEDLSKYRHARLGDVLDHPELMKAYPKLEDIPVTSSWDLKVNGSFDPSTNTISLRDPSEYPATGKDSLKSVLLHEVQHVIQTQEGFARGGNSGEFAAPRVAERQTLMDKARDASARIVAANEAGDTKLADSLIAKRSQIVDQLKEKGLLTDQQIKTGAFRDYQSLAGEVEARNTQERLGMTAADRRAMPPTETADTPRDKQIVRFNSRPTDRISLEHDDQAATDNVSKKLGKYVGQNVDIQPAHQVPDAVSRAIGAFDDAFGGRTIIFENHTPDAIDPQGLTFRDGKRFVNVDADSPLLSVAAHEWFHQLESDRPDLAGELRDEVKRQGRLNDYGAKLRKDAAAGGEDPGVIDDKTVLSELTADAVGDAMTDPDFVDRMAKENPSLFAKFAAHLKAYLGKVISKLKSLGSSKYLDDVQGFRDHLADVMKRYGDESANSEVDQTQTPEFKKWFGDSKVVDAKGEPLVVYHGTDKAFNKFDPKKAIGGQHWFTTDKSAIENRSVGAAGHGRIIDAYLKIENPAGWKLYDKLTLDELIGRGYDGLELPDDGHTVYVAFNPKQIKSASKNVGTFDGDNADIRFSRAPAPDEPPMSLSRIKQVLADRGISPDVIAGMTKDQLRAEQSNMRTRSAPTKETISIKKADVAEEREMKGMAAIEHDLSRADPDLFADAKKRLAENPTAGTTLATAIVANPRPRSDVEGVMLTLDKARIANERRVAYQKASDALSAGDDNAQAEALGQVKALDDQFSVNQVATTLSGHQTGAALRASRLMVHDDYTMAAMVSKAKVLAGRELNTAEQKALEARALEVEKREQAVTAREAAVRNAGREPRAASSRTIAKSKFDSLAAQLKAIAMKDQLVPGCVS
jgi:hypothetical protein